MNSSEAIGRRADTYTKSGYVLTVLAAVSFLNYYDRNLINILLQPIKKSLHLSDAGAGLLVGPAFALVYCFLGVPIARFADRGYRVGVLSAALSVWSVMTALCGIATSLPMMVLARFGVGVGEAGGLPNTHALVAEYFPLERRGFAMSVIAVIAMAGVMSGTFFGGLFNDLFGWRTAFLMAGVPGLLVAALVFLTIREPVRSASAGAPVARFGIWEATCTLARRRSFLYVSGGMAFAALAEYASQAWLPTYLIRHYALTPGELGTRYALVTGIPAVIGMLTGGRLADLWIRRDARAPVWILILTYCIALPLTLVTLLTNSLTLVFSVTALSSLFTGIYIGPNYALIQGLAGAKMRSTAAAVYMLLVNLVGLGAGPLVAGLLSDRLSLYFGADGLRYALCGLLSTYVIGIAMFLKAAQTVSADLADAAKD